jgi:hypothetical protein
VGLVIEPVNLDEMSREHELSWLTRVSLSNASNYEAMYENHT